MSKIPLQTFKLGHDQQPVENGSAHHVVVNEVFYSIQGESTRSGLPCVFVRLTGCHLRCRYCDTAYAFYEGVRRSVEDVVEQVQSYNCGLVEVTGGEPLLQPGVYALMSRLCDAGKTVLVETSGACDISKCDARVVRVMDVKTPGSGEAQRNLWSNVEHLTQRDEVKLVVCDREDYLWSRGVIERYDLAARVGTVLVSAATGPADGYSGYAQPESEVPGVTGLDLRELSQWVLEDRLPVRVQVQLHKLIWDPAMRGV